MKIRILVKLLSGLRIRIHLFISGPSILLNQIALRIWKSKWMRIRICKPGYIYVRIGMFLGLPDPHPDLLVRGTDPRTRIRIRVRIKMSWIPNTGSDHVCVCRDGKQSLCVSVLLLLSTDDMACSYVVKNSLSSKFRVFSSFNWYLADLHLFIQLVITFRDFVARSGFLGSSWCRSIEDQCCGSVTFWYGSESVDPYHGHRDPDPACFVSGWQETIRICTK